MTPDLTKTFVEHYLESLQERTRGERTGAKWGFDWVIYNLGLVLYGKPVRLPFLRGGESDYSKTKSEAEHGVDLSFLSEDERKLTIFVLKKVPLTNRSWTDADFHRDLQMAIYPDLASQHLSQVTKVKVVLAYNKDEEQNGIKAYDLFVANAPKTVGKGATLAFERWNLSDLVALTLTHLLSPALVPQRFFGQLNYLCAQAADFAHGSDQWEQQLIPGWKRFLSDVLAETDVERAAGLIPVALLIIRQQARDNRSIRTGTIDLTEWAAIALWRSWAKHNTDATQRVALRFWAQFYLLELYQFYQEQMPFLATPQSIDQMTQGTFVGTVAASYLGYWHLGRLGLLAMGFAEILPADKPEQSKERETALVQIASWMADMIAANVCLCRPILDIQHIEIYLAFLTLYQTRRVDQLEQFFVDLIERLYLRRFGRGDLPFLDAHNSLENVFEQVATRPAEPLVSTTSSYFVLMLMELSCALPNREHLLALIHRRLVLGAFDEGDPGKNTPLDLISWIAPADWDPKVFEGNITGGEVVSTRPFSESRDATGKHLYDSIMNFVRQTNAVSKLKFVRNTPTTALVLASLRHQSALPPELWRKIIFPELEPAKA